MKQKSEDITDEQLQNIIDKLRRDKEAVKEHLRAAIREQDRRRNMPAKESAAHDISGAGNIESEEA